MQNPQVSIDSRHSIVFETKLCEIGVQLTRRSLDTVQVNLGRLCNQTCHHCHVEAGPARTEIMDRRTAEHVIEFVRAAKPKTVDFTGGAPELNPSFRDLVRAMRQMDRHVLVRSNLTVLLEDGQQDTPAFLADQKVEIIASMPCYTQENVDGQRGEGVYQKSVEAIRRLNALGYGKENSGLVLNLVYNPGGAFLPGPQPDLEADYKRELMQRFGLVFNHLYTITNVDLGRFGRTLRTSGESEKYAELLFGAFNPATLDNLMCLDMVSISWDGCFYDCDFNQMLCMPLGDPAPFRLGGQPVEEIIQGLAGKTILTGPHCYSCTAGTGSSCGGALV